MITPEQYAPILKGKKGEFLALYSLNSDIRNKIVPIIDIVTLPNTKKYSTLESEEKLELHINTTFEYFNKYWDKSSKIYVDGYMMQKYPFLVKHPLEMFFDLFRSNNINAIPVISNLTDINYNNVVKSIIDKDNKGVALRICRKSDLDIAKEIQDLYSFLNINYSEIDLLIDLRSLENLMEHHAQSETLKLLTKIPYLLEWRSFILSGSNFPIDLTKLKPDQLHILKRTEWILWKSLILQKQLNRHPSYSDYAISHPIIKESLSAPVNASASIRYTCNDDFLIYRGKGTKGHGFKQFYDISETLINSSEYYGIDHCEGDSFISNCAISKKKSGNLTTWRMVGTNHHITVAVNQIFQFWRDFK